MSETKSSDAIQQFNEQMAEESKFDALKKETSRNKAMLESVRTKAQLEQQNEDLKDVEILKNSNFGGLTHSQIDSIINDNNEYIDAARRKFDFMLDKTTNSLKLLGSGLGFDKMIPFFRKNLILIGAQTGDGKSTAVANIAYRLIRQKNPVNGNPGRILVLTNEERKEDVYNRITCLINGWAYTNHDQFTDEQIVKFNTAIRSLATRVTIVDNVHNGAHGATTSLEGIEAIFENMIANGDRYDAILIDYYQNVIFSKRDPTLDEWKVQAKLCRMLDDYKNIYPAPIIVLAQINPADEEGNPIFPYRIQGRKLIMTVATCVVEMIVNKKHRVTEWKCWKSRFNECIGESVLTGFDKGRFVPYTEDFKRTVDIALGKQAERELDKASGDKLKEIQEESKDGN